MNDELTLDAGRCALIVQDLQNDVMDRGRRLATVTTCAAVRKALE